jgi:hypothetical protein
MKKIKFYYNGIKVNGGKLIKCFYSLDNSNKDNAPSVSICAKEYDELPAELSPAGLKYHMSDHIDKDRACLKPGDEYYNEARRAALVKEIKHRRAQLESDILYYTKRGQALPEYVNNARAKLVAYENELNA